MILTLKYMDSNFSFKVILFENNLPDFLIYSETYEKNKEMYEKMLINNLSYFENVLQDEFYKVEKVKVKC